MNPVEVVVKDEEIAIYIDREAFRRWLGVTEDAVPWEKADDPKDSEGYKTADGTKKEFPNPAPDRDIDQEGGYETASGHPIPDEDDGINLFDEGPLGIGGSLQEDRKGSEKIKELRAWLKKNKFNYKNFCRYLDSLDEVGGFKLSQPPIGLTQKGEPTLFQLATRYHSYWKGSKDIVAKDYKRFLLLQLEDMGITVQMVEEQLDGEEIDPKNLPKGIEVSV